MSSRGSKNVVIYLGRINAGQEKQQKRIFDMLN